MTVTELPIEIDKERVAEFSRAPRIQKLSLFGSALRRDFDSEKSDIDTLADFAPNALKGLGFRSFAFEDELSKIIGRKVNFCSRLNKQIALQVRRDAIVIYEHP